MADPATTEETKPEVVAVGHVDDIAKLATRVKELLEKWDLDVELRVKPKVAYAANCTASGPGLEGGEVDIPAKFEVQAVDNAGRPLDHGGAPIAARVVAPSGAEVPVALTDNGDGTFRAEYIPREAGPHKVHVTLAGEPIKESPADVTIDPPTPVPSKCTASGPGLEGAHVGIDAPFTIVARNKAGMQLKVGGHDFAAELHGPFEAVVKATVVDNGDGTYAASYVARAPGAAKVAVTVLAGKPIAQSPFAVVVAKNPVQADAEKSIAFGPGVEGGCDTADPATFTVQAITPSGERMTTGGAMFEVTVKDKTTGKKAAKLPATLVDNGDGTYSGSYQPIHVGKHIVAITLRSPTEPLFFEHIAKSPFQLDVLPGLDPSKCRVDGPGITSGQVDDVHPTTFTIHAVDILGHDITKGGETFVVAVTKPDGKPVEHAPAVRDNGNGTYTVEWETMLPGDHTVTITRKDKPVAASPYVVNVTAGSDDEHTSMGSFGFTIQARDRRGEPLTVGGAKMEVIIKKDEAGAEPVEGVVVTDHGNGMYSARYKLDEQGVYLISILLNGRKIKGTPFKQHIVF